MANNLLENKLDNLNTLPIAIVIAGVFIGGAILYKDQINPTGNNIATARSPKSEIYMLALEEIVLPSNGVVLPISWGNLGAQLVNTGVIDVNKFKAIYEQRGAFTEEYENLLLGQNDGKLKITRDNAGYLLNLFWALGLANQNDILENGEMTNPRYGGASNFASTGGWTMAVGNTMDHYSKHKFFDLTPEQQALVVKVSKGVYRPCCNNSTYFPDCNHGMAMLGLLELLASQGASEQEMWKAALAVNSHWFPDTYITIAIYMEDRGIEWKNVDPQEILGPNYSSASGFQRISSQVRFFAEQGGGGGCGVGAGLPAQRSVLPSGRQQNGCSI